MEFPLILEFENFSQLMTVLSVIGSAVSTIVFLGYKFGKRFGNKFDKKEIEEIQKEKHGLATKLGREKKHNERLSAEIKELKQINFTNATKLKNAQNVWDAPRNYDFETQFTQLNKSKPIITIANFKGGVGKTTVAANLAAYFKEIGKKVLLIDFDYQGTLTETIRNSLKVKDPFLSSNALLSDELSPKEILQQSEPLHGLFEGSRLFPAFYELNDYETHMLLKWFNGSHDEIRFNLHKYLSSSEFQETFDVTIIDAPPRPGTAVVNAACASTHLLIPTILDHFSVEATLNTTQVFNKFREELNPQLKLLGIIPSKVSRVGYSPHEERELIKLTKKIPEIWHGDDPVSIYKSTPIYNRADIAKHSGLSVPYLVGSNSEIRTMFNNLGEKIAVELNLKKLENTETQTIMAGE